MIVCLCRGISDGAVHAAIRRGAATVADIAAACSAGSDCGACRGSLLDLLAEAEVRKTGVLTK
jgi:bacterioferritin-associated ferredoxin